MAVYFIPKSQLFTSQLPSSSIIQNKWTANWITIYKSYYKSRTKVQTNGVRHFATKISETRTNDQQNLHDKHGSHNKGKSSKIRKFRKTWSWKAGAGWTILSVLDWWLIAAGGWLTWRGLLLKWTPLGIGLAAAIHWHLRNQDCDRKGLPRTASRWMTDVYCSLPLRLLSRTWGWLADCRIPIPMRPMVYGAYSTAFGVNINEASNPNLKDYRSISEFFTRSLKPDARLIHDISCVVSPADGTVLHFGLATGKQIEQVKGVNYSLESFLGPNNWEAETDATAQRKYLEDFRLSEQEDTCLYQCVIYLAPGDYHRFHSPTEWQPEVRRHFAGELLSVSPKIASWLPGLFCLNERALYLGRWQHGFFSFTAVGATNVGSVQIYIDEDLKTNRWHGLKVGKHNKSNDYDERKLPNGTKLGKGELLGQFNMGSTVVLVFEAPKKFRFFIENGQKIKMGEPLGCINDIASDSSQID